jgi:hypothetical protein
MSEQVEIFIPLLDENVDVWRPVKAVLLFDNVYRIADQSYDHETESWEYEPGTEVVCEAKPTKDGQALVAVMKYERPGNAS